jgi:hypothetical protein
VRLIGSKKMKWGMENSVVSHHILSGSLTQTGNIFPEKIKVYMKEMEIEKTLGCEKSTHCFVLTFPESGTGQ